MSKLSLLLAPLSAVAALVVLLGPSGAPHGSPAPHSAPAGASATPSPAPEDAAPLDEVVEAYRSEPSLQSAADLLDAAIGLDGARRDRVRRLEAFGPSNLPASGTPEVGFVLDENDRAVVLFLHEQFPEHAELERALERAASDPWYEVEQGLLLQVEARVGATLPAPPQD